MSTESINLSRVEKIHRENADFRARWVNLYTLFFSGLGILITLVALFHLPDTPFYLAAFCGLAILVELFSVELFSSARFSRVSVTGIISLAGILIYGPIGGALVGATVGLVTIYTTAKGSAAAANNRASWLRRGFFNLGMFVSSAFLAGWVYLAAGGDIGQPSQIANIPALIAAAFTGEFINVLVLTGVLTLQTGRGLWDIWQQNFAWAIPVGILGSIIGGWAMAASFEMYRLLGLLVFLLPVITTSYSLRLYVRNSRKHVTQLEQMNITLDQTNLGLLETLGAVIDAYDMYTYGHSAQVAIYVEVIAEKLHLSKEDQAAMIKAALVHDIGKVGITDTIIGKPGPLSDDEYHLVQRHPVIGADILRRTPGMQELTPLVRHHHERWDGAGYPAGLAGEEIPLGARVISIADAVDAMVSARPYRKMQSIEDVRREILRCSGSQFDPQIVAAFLEVLNDKDASFFIDSGKPIEATVLKKGVGSTTIGARYMKRSMVVD